MKKFTLFLVATLFSALSFAAALNPYAYGLSSTLDGTTLKVNYSLNAPATAVSVVIMDGEAEVKTIACDGKTAKGSHTVEISTLDLPTGKSLTWKVNVTGAAVAKATAVKTYRFFHPSGIDVDNNPESSNFGRILCLEANHSVKTTTITNGYLGKGYGAGIYAFDAAFDKITNGSYPGFNGGNTFTTTHYAVRRIRISDDGRIFVTAQNNGGCFLWEVDPDNLNNWTKVFNGTASTYTTTTADGKFMAGTNSGFDVHGSGENLKLVMLSASKSGANVSTFRCDEYDLGTKTEWSTVPSRTIPGANYHIVTSQSNIQYDKDGGVWHIQYRGTCDDANPGLVHINKDGVEDYKLLRHNTRNAGFCFNKDFTKVIVAGKFQNGTGTQKYATIYAVSKDVDGKPVLTEEQVVDMTNIGYALNDFAWDWADNIYAVDNNGEYLCAYALPHAADKVVSTPCASKYAFEVEEIVANVYTLTTNVVGEGTVGGNAGSYVDGATATLTATPAEHYDFENWTYGSETSTANPLTITVNSDLTVTANFQEHTKYTITAHAADNTMGYVTGGKAYYAGETVTLKAVANSTYYFVNWSDGVTDAIRTFTATADVTLTANFAKATPRAWAYDLKVAEDGDNYKFTFNATTAGTATLLFADKEGNALAPTSYDLGAINAGLNTATVAKSLFTEPKDIYWSVKMDGEAIPAVAEITDQSRNIYDFYNMQGVVVDNDPNSEKFGEIYIEMAKSGTTNGKAQTLGLFLLNQNLDVLNTDPNVGIQPTMPSGYALNGTNYTFQRLNIHPKTGDLVFSYGISSKPAVFAIDRENMTGSVTNLLDGITGLTKTVAHCFDEDGALYVMDIVSYKGTIYKIKDGVKSTFSAATGKYAADNITMTSDGRGGLWVAQNRGQIDACYQLAHVNSEGVTDWSIYDDQGGGTSSTGFTGYSTRGALAYDAERQILAQGRNSAVELFNVTYDPSTGIPTLTKFATTPVVNKANIDGLAFDYAGDLYMVNSGTEKFYKYTLPTAENICTVPAPESQKIVKEVRCTVTVNVVGNGEVEGAGEYIEGTSVSLTATPAEHHRFIGWTGDKTSMDNPLEFVAESNITLTATFEPIPQYNISVSANDGEMGSVTGGGDYYEGSTATLTATPVGGYVFEKWSDNNTDNPRTITVNGAAAYTAIFKVAPARVFAYNLDVVENGDDTYTLSFIPNANATSGRVILYNDDTKAQIHEAPIEGTIAKGVKSEVVVSKSVMPTSGTVTWAVELTGEPVEALTLLTDNTDRTTYGFNRPQGVAIDNNPASDYFGRMYIALPKAGGTYYTDKNYGIVVMDPLHNRLKSGVISNGDALGADGRYSMHRVAVNPTNGHVYYVRTSDINEGVTSTAIYELAPDATNILTDGGTAKNVISGVSDITNANSVCFDENGVMYVVANANYVDGASTGRVYKVVDGVATLVTQSSREIASKDNAIVPDGKGGFWIAQHRNNLDGFNHLLHINSSGVADYTISKDENANLLPVQTYTEDGKTYNNASYRGQVAYYSIDENNGLVAYGGGAKVSVFKVSYDGAGKPSLTAWQTISLLTQSTKAGVNVDGIAFDYAGNIIVMSATDERMYQYALPIETANTSLVPSPTSKAIKLGTIYNIGVAVNDPAMGSATGGGEYVEGETATLKATPAAHHKFVNWTYGSETSTDNPLELVVEGNITVTANFEPVQYTLITPTNDENKGTVAGAGTYAHGTVATLTATPKEGYKLLYWSDRSTENPRSITMTKNEAISAYFVKEYDEEPTFKIEKIWENTQVPGSADGYQAVGWDGNIYMQNKTAGKIKVYTNDTDAAVDYATSNTSGQQIAVDEAGNLIVFNAYFATATPSAIQIYKNGSTTGTAISFTLPHPERCDFISASGDIYSAEGGYVYFYCQNKHAVNRVKITNGALASVDAIGNTEKPATSVSHVMVDIFGNLAAHCRSTAVYAINSYTGETTAFTTTLSGVKLSTLGGCTFELGGKELWAYNVGTTNYNSEWNLYNMTDKVFMSNETLYAKDKDSRKTTGPANWLNVQVVDENTAYIYQFCPEVAVAMWKVSINRTDLQEFTVTASANDPTMGTVTGGDTYYEEATATLIATPNAGYKFVNWTQAGVEVSTNATYTFTVTEDVELVANFEALPTITYELNGGVWNKYGWTSKKDMYDAFIADWKAYSGSTRGTKTYEEQYGIGKSNGGIPTTIQGTEDILGFMSQEKWAWLAQFLDAIATAQGTKLPSEATVHMRFALGNFFGEDNNKVGDSYVDAVDCSGDNASLSAFAPYWGQTFPLPTQPTEEIVLNAPYKEGYLFDGWYAEEDFSGTPVTTVDQNTDGTLYAKWIESVITVTIDDGPNNTAALTPHEGETVTVKVNRNFGEDKILTLTLPFDMSATQISTYFGNATIYEFYNVVDAGEELHLQFYRTTSIEAGKPYILQTTSGYDAVDGFTIEDVTITTALSPVEIDGITMMPVLDGDGELNQSTEYYLSNNALYCAGTYPQSLLGLRAYFTSPSPTPIRARVVFGENEATSIPMVTTPETKAQKIIQDGRLIIIRGEHQYNAQGQIIE